jgi:hypothetical protein
MKNNWSTKELQVLDDNPTFTTRQLQNLLDNRSLFAIRTKRYAHTRRQIHGAGTYVQWSDCDLTCLKEIWPDTAMDLILQRFPERTYSALKAQAHKLGVARPQTARHGTLRPFFDGSYQSFYWLGFIVADGSISKHGNLRVWTSAKDREHTKQLADWLETTLHEDPKRNAVGFGVGDKVSCEELASTFGIRQRKTYDPPTLHWLTTASLDIFTAFFAGYIDGDGCIHKTYNTITITAHSSWVNTLQFLETLAKKHWSVSSSSLILQKYCTLRIRLDSSVRDHLYTLNLPLISRKWDRITSDYNAKHHCRKRVSPFLISLLDNS